MSIQQLDFLTFLLVYVNYNGNANFFFRQGIMVDITVMVMVEEVDEEVEAGVIVVSRSTHSLNKCRSANN